MKLADVQDVAAEIRRIRQRIGLTQTEFAQRLNVSFPTVSRWENGHAKPSQLAWDQLTKLAGEEEIDPQPRQLDARASKATFTSSPETVRAVVEGERLSFGHLSNPAFATETSSIDPLPHQRIAVYDHLLKHPRLRFLLADDAGAGKTIMTGLYIREMLSRRLIRRVLIVPPAGLIGNWQNEMHSLFNLPFSVVTGTDARGGNPFIGPGSDRVVVSVDTLAGPKVFARLQEAEVEPYDLVVFDEAHKLSVNRTNDLRVRKTGRYELAESLAGVRGLDPSWQLTWSPHHLLLLTATPHQGKPYPYYGLWRLLEPDVLSTPEAFESYPVERRQSHFIRRTKEEMVHLSGAPLYPKRISDTLGFRLSQGLVSEQTLYNETTDYMRHVYNRAKLLNRSAARLAMSVMQRRLASSTYALTRSFERRIERLDELIRRVQDNNLTGEEINLLQRRLADEEDVFDTKTGDEERTIGDREESEVAEGKLLSGVIATSLADLYVERDQVATLLQLARQVHADGSESKFEKLQEVITSPKFAGEKLIVFTEHRDTLDYLVGRLGGLGHTGRIAQIHGGMDYKARQEAVERFRRDHNESDGARFMICTDAAAEGINLQFCWIMINFDVPWNPARLEQRMGRIHRYGQKHDPVNIINLVSPDTREGKVIETLLAKLELIRDSLGSEKVFDSIGRLFEGVSLSSYMEQAVVEGADSAVNALAGKLTPEQVEALAAQERMLYGDGGDVKKQLPRLRADLMQETYRRLLPGYVRQYLESAGPPADIGFDGDLQKCFSFTSMKVGAIDPILPMLELYNAQQRHCLSVVRPSERGSAVWVHPGEPVFEAFRNLVSERLGQDALNGAVFVDPTANKPYLFHVALATVDRAADKDFPDLATLERLECRLIGIRQYGGTEMELCPVEHLMLLGPGRGLPATAQRLAADAEKMCELADAYLTERVGRDIASGRRNQMLATLTEREQFIRRGFSFQESELAAARNRLSEKARGGNAGAMKAIGDIREQQRSLSSRRQLAIDTIHREPELVLPGKVVFVAHALIVPSSDPDDLARHDADVERVGMDVARAHEESQGAEVKDVSTPALARAAGLTDNPGFDLLAIYPSTDPRGRRAIEVKGRSGTGDVEVSSNEWARAANLRDQYWLYVVYDCATPSPKLVRVKDPFGNLLATAKGSVLIKRADVVRAEREGADK
jgi:SNF2 family DNA or RNA helicase